MIMPVGSKLYAASLPEAPQPATVRSDLGHKVENLAIAAGIELPLRTRAKRFLNTSAPHHREREWYKLIEAFLSEKQAIPQDAFQTCKQCHRTIYCTSMSDREATFDGIAALERRNDNEEKGK